MGEDELTCWFCIWPSWAISTWQGGAGVQIACEDTSILFWKWSSVKCT